MVISLHTTQSPVSRAERNKINENWQSIIAGLTYLQQQIKVLAGGAEVDELIQRLNDAIDNANVAVQEAIELNNAATHEAIEANNTALQIALDTVSQTLVEINAAILSANTATTDANVAKQGALDATTQAQTSINTMQTLIKNMGHQGTWSNTIQYYKNNMVEYNSSTFIAVQDNLGKQPPTLPTKNNAYWSLFAEQGTRGPQGLQGLPGKDGKDGTGVNIIGELISETELPTTGSPGDAYMIHGDLYVWQDNTSTWKNVGPIRGPEGPQGPAGPQGEQGPPGEGADTSALDAKVDKKILEYGGLLTGTIDFNGLTSNRLYQVGGVNEDSIGMPPISTGMQYNGAYSSLEDLLFGTYRIQRLTQMIGVQIVIYRVQEKGKEWSPWRVLDAVNTYQPTKTITNLGNNHIVRNYGFINWKNNNITSEVADIYFADNQNISGIYELTLSSTFANSNATGGAKVLYHVMAGDKQIHGQEMTIIDISDAFASHFYISNFKHYGDYFYLQVIKRSSNNPLTIELNYQSYGSDGWDVLNNSFVSQSVSDRLIPSSEIGIQESRFAKRDKSNFFYNEVPFVLQRPGLKGHVFHEAADSTLHIAPTISVDSPNGDFLKSVKIDANGILYTNKILVDGVDLKQSVSNGKANVAQAITDVGWYTSPTATFDEMASNIRRLGTIKEARGKVEASAGYITVRGLGFRPIAILCKAEGTSDAKMGNAAWVGQNYVSGWSDVSMYVSAWDRTSIQSDVTTYEDGFRMRVDDTNRNGFFGYYCVGKNI